MDNCDQRVAEPTAGGGGESCENSGDWRVQLLPDFRQSIVNKIMGIIGKRLSSEEGLEQLRRIAVQFEERVYTSAKSQSDYLQRITVKMLKSESKSQSNTTNHLTSGPTNNDSNSVSIDSKPQPDEQITEEMQEQVYQKMKTMKDLYLHELNDMYKAILVRTQQQPQSLDQMRKLAMYKKVLEISMAFIQIPKSQITLRTKIKLAMYEKYIKGFLSSIQKWRPGQNPNQMMQQPQPQITPVQSHESQTNSQLQSLNSQNSIPEVQQNSTNVQQSNITNLLQNSMSTAATQQSLIHSNSNMKTQEMSNIHQINDKSDMMPEGMGVKPGGFQPPSGQHPPHEQAVHNASSQNMQDSSLPTDQQDLFNKAGTPLQSATAPLVLSPSTPKDPSPMPRASDGHIPAVPMHSNARNLGSPLSSTVAATPQSHAIGNPGISASPMLKDNTDHDDTYGNAPATASGHLNEQPIERPIRMVQSVSPETLSAYVSDRFKQSETCDLESSPTSCAKRPEIMVSNLDYHALLNEFERINQQLLDTSISISDEYNVNITPTKDGVKINNGIMVKCSYNGLALGPPLNSHYVTHLSPIQPLRLYVPSDYPKSSPQFLDIFPTEVSNDREDLSSNAKSKFGMYMRSLEKPLSLWDIVQTWDRCTREVLLDYA